MTNNLSIWRPTIDRKPGTPRIRPKSGAILPNASSTAVYRLALAIGQRWESERHGVLRSAGLGPAHGKLMYGLSHCGPITVSNVARRLGLSRQACQQTANQLIRRGFITKRENPAHRRSPYLELTNQGIALIDRMLTLPEQPSKPPLTPANLRTTTAVLEALLE